MLDELKTISPRLTREEARKDLREYDNSKNGRNPNFKNLSYLREVEIKYNMDEDVLRKWANEKKKRKA